MRQVEIRLAGEGGQGLILAGIILAEAACVHDGKNAVQTQSYGPESRGGASKAEVIISDSEIDYPKVTRPDIMLVMSQMAYDKYIKDLKQGGVLIYDSSIVKVQPSPDHRTYAVPITATARERVGREIVANIVALGALVKVCGVVSEGAIREAVANRVPRGTEGLNLRALDAGMEVVGELLDAPR